MKHKLKILQGFIYLCFTLGIIFGCAQEKDYVNGNSDYKMKRISFEYFQGYKNAFAKFNDLKSKRESMKTGRIVYDSINDFYFDTDKILLMEKDGQNYFTLLIKRDYEETKTENLVLKPDSFGNYVPFLIKYNFTESDKENVLNGNLITSLESKMETKILDEFYLENLVICLNRTTICWKVTVATCSYGNHDDVTGYAECNGYSEQTFVFCWDSDDGSDGNGGGDGNPENSDGNGGGDGNGGTPNTPLGNQTNNNGATTNTAP